MITGEEPIRKIAGQAYLSTPRSSGGAKASRNRLRTKVESLLGQTGTDPFAPEYA